MRKRGKTPSEHPELGLPEVRPLWETAGLFSDHYLRTRLKQNAWWPSDDQAMPHWEFCRDLYNRRYLALARGNEATVRQELIDKALRQLGFDWIDNLGLPDQDAEPDYLLFASSAEKEAVLEESVAQRYRAAVAILEAKKLHHPLSQLSKHQLRYPHQQIRDYLLDAQVLNWGILTNGNVWRLYCRDAKRHEYFEMNFELAVLSLDNFKCFLALFGPDTFQRDARGRCRLDDIRDQAMTVQIELEENLRQRIFTVLTDLANGFDSHYNNRIGDDLDRLYENCLIYLYRLLFVLYAEGRGLLPVNRPDRKYYKNLSLARLRHGLQDFSEHDDRHLTRLCENIRDLFRLINGAGKGVNEDYGVPRYNGGLFDSRKYPLPEEWRIADPDLAAVLRGLMFSPPPEREKPMLPIESVDFGDLRVQHLGSIYEGLLEHRLVRGDDNRLCLDVARAERKATGTYYTPDYIVKHIVENTLGPLLKDIEDSEAVKSSVAANRRDNSFAEEVLKLNILDPAMGSGHFLVEAVTYLADHIVHHPTTRYLDGDKRGEPKSEQEIAHWRRRVVEACIYGVDLNPLAVELARLSLWLVTIATDKPLNFLDHHLRCGNSLIGARLNDLGELPEKRRKMMVKEAAQARLVFGPKLKEVVGAAIREIHLIESEASDSVDAVKAKEGRWEEHVIHALAPYKAVADLWTATHFGFDLDQETYTASASRIIRVGYRYDYNFTNLVEREDSPGDSLTEWRDIAAARRFFHWELEFPEIFFNEDGSPKDNPGFDAVIGNPPYVSFGLRGVGKVGEEEKEYYLMQFGSSAEYKISLYALFMEAALKLTRIGGYQGYIVPDSFLLGKYFSRVRECILEQAVICSLMLFHEDFWKSGTVGKPVVYVTHKNAGSEERGEHKVKALTIKSLQDAIDGFIQSDEIPQKFFADSRLRRFRLILGADTRALFERIESAAPPLEKFVKFYSGLIGLRGQDAVTLTKKPADYSPEKYGRLVASSGNLQRYSLSYEGLYCPKDSDVYKSGYKPEIYEKPKLFLNQTGDHLKCCFDLDGFYCLNNMHVGYPTNTQFDLRYSNTILCSRLMDFYYKAVSLEKGRANAQTDIDVIDALPIRRIAFTTPKAERERHMKKAQKTCERGLRDNDAGTALSAVDEHLNASRADVVHDLLAFLAERMMALNNEKHEAAQGFFTNLKEFYGVDARSMKPKTRLDEFWKLETTDVFAHFKANARLLAAQGVILKEADEDKIRSRFQKAKDKIVPVQTALTFTDRLIDRIVYRLYDLTQDEIAIVEGQS